MNTPRFIPALFAFALFTAAPGLTFAQPSSSTPASAAPASTPADDLASDPDLLEPVREAEAVIDHRGGIVTTPDGVVSVKWGPNPTRPPTPAKVWSIIAPGGAGFSASGPAGPANITCWPPNSGLPPGSPGAAVDPVKSGPPASAQGADGGVEILGPDQEWTTIKSTLNRDGSRTIEIVDERKPLRKQGLVKSSTGPYVLYPQRSTVLRGKTRGLHVVDQRKQQQEWKDAVKRAAAEEEDELAPIKKTNDAQTPGDEADDLAPIKPINPAGQNSTLEDDDLAPISKTPGATGDPEIDELAPISKSPAPDAGTGGKP
jgi:hypothetical protein